MKHEKFTTSPAVPQVGISPAFNPFMDIEAHTPEGNMHAASVPSAHEMYSLAGQDPNIIFGIFLAAVGGQECDEDGATLGYSFALGVKQWDEMSGGVPAQKFDAVMEGLHTALKAGFVEDNQFSAMPIEWDSSDVKEETFKALGGDLFTAEDAEEGAERNADFLLAASLAGYLCKWSELSGKNLGRNMAISTGIRDTFETILNADDLPAPTAPSFVASNDAPEA